MIRRFFLAGHTSLRIGLLLAGGLLAAGFSVRFSTAAPIGSPIYLIGQVSDRELITFTCVMAGREPDAVILVDSAPSRAYIRAFLKRCGAERVTPVGKFAEPPETLAKALGVSVEPVCPLKDGLPAKVWKSWVAEAERIIVCATDSRRLLLHAACLAGVWHAPLLGTTDSFAIGELLHRSSADSQTPEVCIVGETRIHLPKGARVRRLRDESAVVAASLEHRGRRNPVHYLVVANPEDQQDRMGSMSALAPWIAIQHGGALALTNAQGSDAQELVEEAMRVPTLAHLDGVIWAASPLAIPSEQRPNPEPGKDAHIDMEPLTPTGNEPVSVTSGRLFHLDRSVVPLMLARQRLLAGGEPSCRALVVSNPGGSLPLLETFSRTTARELQNCGYETTALFNDDVDPELLRRVLPEQNIFLWEGHHMTMVRDYGMPQWTEPMSPSLVCLQSCLALNTQEAQPLLRRGAVGVVGSSTRTFSASGGAFTLAFFDALLYENQSVGGALRRAKNFLLCYSLLKEKRLGDKMKLQGANVRSAWAFTLWGDPSFKLPLPANHSHRLAPVRQRVIGNSITLLLPERCYEPMMTGKYLCETLPNARLAGLLSKEEGEDGQKLVPFLFAEVHLPRGADERVPHLRSRVPESHWVFTWDRRRACGYLLVTPRPKDQTSLHFHVEWEPARPSAPAQTAASAN